MLSKRSIAILFLILSQFVKGYGQVSLQNGSAVFSLPMFDWKDNKSRLMSSVSLTYSSGNGLRVNDIASNEGQGWALAAGGAITRMQVGEPDDQPEYKGTAAYGHALGADQDKTKYPAGYLYAPIPASQGCPNALTKYPIYGSKNQIYTQRNSVAEDRQLDYFSFQFNGKSGQFILDASNGDNGASLGDSKMKITFQRDAGMTSQGIRTTITSFQIQDVDGLIYKFTKHGLTKLLQASFCDAKVNKEQAQPKIGNNGIYHQAGFDVGPTSYPWINKEMAYPYVINTWYLSEIDEPLTSRIIRFNYFTRNINNIAGADIMYNNSLDKYIVISHKRSVSTSLEIASIIYPDGHLVNFNYAANPRIDFAGEYALNSVDVTYQPRPQDPVRPISEYQLTTSYFILNRYGTPISDYEKKSARLCLLSVKKIGVDLKEDSPPYIFDYYTGSTGDDFVPPPFFYAKDIWGFYNGTNSTKSDNSGSVPLVNTNLEQLDFTSLKGLCFQKDAQPGTVVINPKANYARNGLLRQIVYPTGGSLIYQYVQNSGIINGTSSSVNVAGVHVSQTSSSDGGFSNGCGNPIVTLYNYVMNGAGSASSLWGIEAPVNSIVSNNYFAWEIHTIHWSLLSCPIGCCKWHFLYPGILSQNEAIDLTGMQKIMNALAPILGVLTIITNVLDVINVCLDATPLAIVAVAIDIIAGAITWIIGCTQYTKSTPDVIYYNFDLNGGSGLPTQFKRVEIVENPGTIGKTVEEFTSSDDYDIWSLTNPTFSAKQRYAPWAYGLPKLITIYDAANRMIRQTKNVYNQAFVQEAILGAVSGSHQIPDPIMSCKCQVIYNSSQPNTNWSDQTQYDDPNSFIVTSNPGVMNVDLYPMYTGRMELDTTYERLYRVGDASNYIETATKYTYDIDNYQMNSATVLQSNGNKTSKFITYSDHLGPNQLSDNNILCEPLEISTSVIPAGSGVFDWLIDDYNYYYSVYGPGLFYVTSDKYTQYGQIANGDVRPLRMLEQRFAAPTDGSAYFSSIASAFSSFKTVQTFTYDASSNLTGTLDEGGHRTANIYEYNDKYIVASVINADPVVDKPAYTSFEGPGFGGWTVTGNATAYSTASYITGVRGFDMTGNTLTAGLNTGKAYILSFWASNSNGSVSAGATNVKNGPVYNGMHYYEFSVAQGTTTISITGSFVIDELRLYPANAQMHSTTYDPLLGKTSECDENNRIVYYEYDNLGRMRFIRDESRNIIKMYEYNSVSAAKQNGCPASYSNHLITEVFTKMNCSTGFQGGSITYTVAAGKYTSTIGQWYADALAELELMQMGQSTANTSGGCSQIFYNPQMSVTIATASCPDGYTGGSVTYTVPASTYSSIISQQDATQQAQDDLDANGDAFANDPANAVCTIDTNPNWEWAPGDATKCQAVGTDAQQHLFYLATDQNPNSATWHQTAWQDSGPSATCPANVIIYARLTYENQVQDASGAAYADIVVRFYSNASGTVPLSVTGVTVNYDVTNNCPTSNVQHLSQTCSGLSKTLSAHAQISPPPPVCPPTQICPLCTTDYTLTTGTGYTKIN